MLRSVHRHGLIRPLLFLLVPFCQGLCGSGKVDLPSCALSLLLVQRHLLARVAGPGLAQRIVPRAEGRFALAQGLLGRRTIYPHPQEEQGMAVHQSMSGRLFERHATRGTIDSKYCNPGTLTSVSQDNSTQKRVRCSLCEVR